MTDVMYNRAPPPAIMQQVSVIVVNYNAGDLLMRCIGAILPQAGEVIVVDNGSTDGSLDHLAQWDRHPRLRILRNGINLGFAAGCNIGIAAAQGERLFFLNPDSVVEPDTLPRLLETLEANANCGMVGGLLLNPDGTEQRGGRRRLPTPWSALLRFSGLARLARRWPHLFPAFDLDGQPLPAQPEPVEAISGACMLVRREAVQQVGDWDEGYFLHCEDLDWCMRFKRSGWSILFVPAATLVHAQGTCSRSRPLFVEWHKHKGMLRFHRKFTTGWRYWLLAGPVTLGVYGHFGLVLLRHLALRAATGRQG